MVYVSTFALCPRFLNNSPELQVLVSGFWFGCDDTDAAATVLRIIRTREGVVLRVGIDTGGTFTDFVVLDGNRVSVFKLPSTRAHPEKAVLSGLARVAGDRDRYLAQHGSTVATNALLEGTGSKTLLITNQGFEDLLEIGRQNRPDLYSLTSSRPPCLVPPRFRVGLRERTLWDGSTLVELEKKSLDWLKSKVEQLKPESIAVVLLYSYINPENEKKIAEVLADSGIPISLSHEILPEFREYERTSTTVVNAYLAPTMSRYLSALQSHQVLEKGQLTIMQSNGGSMSVEAAQREPVRTIFSGPAGGVVGAFRIARRAGWDRILTLDMGGTSTDVSLCDGEIQTTNESKVSHHPVSVQMVGIHSIGAGGGSIAWVDKGGLLRVGPESAGADPGPVCYGKGTQVTVTDCNILLGRLEPDYFLGGEMLLFPEKITRALRSLGNALAGTEGKSRSLEEIAEGVLRICNTQMERALRVISLERGFDTRDFSLVAFGGAGGLHACELARSLMIPRVLIPLNPGALSATGILEADVVKDAVQTVLVSDEDIEDWTRLNPDWERLQNKVRQQLEEMGFGSEAIRIERSLDIRYRGQSHEITVPFGSEFVQTFHEQHRRRFGYSNPGLPIEAVNLRTRASARYPYPEMPRHALESIEPPLESMIQEKQVIFNGIHVPTRFYLRRQLRAGNRIQGPAVILEYSSTTLVPSDFHARIDEWLNIVIEPS